MAAVHDVLRYLLERVPHSTQEDHDRVAALIDSDEQGGQPAQVKKETQA